MSESFQGNTFNISEGYLKVLTIKRLFVFAKFGFVWFYSFNGISTHALFIF